MAASNIVHLPTPQEAEEAKILTTYQFTCTLTEI